MTTLNLLLCLGLLSTPFTLLTTEPATEVEKTVLAGWPIHAYFVAAFASAMDADEVPNLSERRQAPHDANLTYLRGLRRNIEWVRDCPPSSDRWRWPDHETAYWWQSHHAKIVSYYDNLLLECRNPVVRSQIYEAKEKEERFQWIWYNAAVATKPRNRVTLAQSRKALGCLRDLLGADAYYAGELP